MFKKDLNAISPQAEPAGALLVISVVKWLGIAILTTIAAAIAYGIYIFYIVDNLYEEITEGGYHGIEIGEERSAVWRKLPNFSSSHSTDGYREIEFLEPINHNNAEPPAHGYVRYRFPKGLSAHQSQHQTWVIYSCPSACDWRREHKWVSFNFEGNTLSSIIRYKRRRPELP